MRILVVGGGGREHAMVDKLAGDAPEAEILAAPGNPGIARLATCVPVAADDIAGLAALAEDRSVDLTVVGPEVPLAAGIADLFAARGLPLFGPGANAARIESSKAFAKRLMRQHGVPTAEFADFATPVKAHGYVDEKGAPIVIKASGLAAGKGAIVCETLEQAHAAVDELMVESRFGTAGETVVIEEFMEGVEFSAFFLCDGERAVPLLPSRDYKRIGEGDVGLNTGGMGAYAPAGVPGDAPGTDRTADAVLERIHREIALPVLEGLAAADSAYRGFLYAGVMLTDAGPRVVEFNCRLGDPEAQVVLPMTAGDLVAPMLAVARGESLAGWRAEPRTGSALTTVIASAGYPGSYDAGVELTIPDLDSSTARVYHAGTAMDGDRLVSAGGRVLAVTGLGVDLEEAGDRSRETAAAIAGDGLVWRHDIGWHERAAAPAAAR